MATTAVGVRQFKLHAPTSVARAARGDHIVISRHGKPQAQLRLIEASPSDGPAQGWRMLEWLAGKNRFERLRPRMEAKYRRCYAAIHQGRSLGVGADPEQLHQRTWQTLRRRTFFIGRVGGPPTIADMPGFEVEPVTSALSRVFDPRAPMVPVRISAFGGVDSADLEGKLDAGAELYSIGSWLIPANTRWETSASIVRFLRSM